MLAPDRAHGRRSGARGRKRTDAVSQNLDAIRNDFKDISGAVSDLSSDPRDEVEAANKAFASSVQEIVGEVGRSLSASHAKAKLVTALQQLEASYQKSFAQLSCD